MNGGLAVAVVAFALSSYVVGNAYVQKQQFYPTVVHLTKSNSYMAVLYMQALVLVWGLFKFLQRMFFGQLRAAETEHLIEKLWYAIPDTCLAFTFFSQDFSPQFVAMFTILLVVKAFHWLCEDRVDFMDRSPNITWLFHARAIVFIILLGFTDLVLSITSLTSVLNQGPSVQVVFAFEYAILLTMVGTIIVKYILHTVDLAFDHPWENKAIYLLYSDLILEFIRVMLYYTLIYFFLVKVHTPPLFAFRPSYQSFMRMYKCIRDIVNSRRAIANINSLRNATAEQLAAMDNVCIVCREDMVGDGSCKCLPCNHVFHTACLRRWFQRQQTCPTCRTTALGNTAAQQQAQQPAAAAAAPAAAAAAAAAGAQPGGAAAAAGAAMHGVGAQQPGVQGQVPPPWIQAPAGMPFPQPPFGMFMPPPPQFAPPPQQQAAAGGAGQTPADAAAAAAGTGAGSSASSAPGPQLPAGDPFAGFTPGLVPPFFPPPPPFLMGGPPVPLPPDFSKLSDEQLHKLEGDERANVEARVLVLRNIQQLLDAAVEQMEVYYHHSAQPAATGLGKAARSTPRSQPKADAHTDSFFVSPENLTARQASSSPKTTGASVEDVDNPAELRQRRLDWLRSTSQLSESGSVTSPLSPTSATAAAATADTADRNAESSTGGSGGGAAAAAVDDDLD